MIEVVDTNILVRLLVGDIKKQEEKYKKTMHRSKRIVANILKKQTKFSEPKEP